ncbi:MAG TPA: GNAT family N-acetyltransferase [Miltoncostaeaceae bacterium]|nr:GNAT family N-acetyltransferase [Miltoncostaeaceae bacterium]
MPGRGARAERPPIVLPNPPLVAGALHLRAPAERDIEAIHAACQDPLIVRYTRLPHNYSRRDARAFVFGAPARRDAGISLELVASDLDDGSLTGVVGLVVDRYDWERAEIGYWTDPAHRGRGIAGTALALLARWALGRAEPAPVGPRCARGADRLRAQPPLARGGRTGGISA